MRFQLTNNNITIGLKDFLKKNDISRRMLKKLKNIMINDFSATLNDIIYLNDIVSFEIEEKISNICAYKFQLNILFEDDYILIVDKPCGIQSIPSTNEPDISIANAVQHYFSTTNQHCGIHVVTRLDKDTSGIIIFAKHCFIHSLLQKNNCLKKYYIACTTKHLYPSSGIINKPILKIPGNTKHIIDSLGKTAITEYTLHSYLTYYITLHTGRTHQIRLHFASCGAPLIGDRLYGDVSDSRRLGLHCIQVEFFHPITNHFIEIHSPIPNDLTVFKEKNNA